MLSIQKKIVSYQVKADEVAEAAAPAQEPKIERPLPELMPRPEKLVGSTYKVKAPIIEQALYVTINDIEETLPDGTVVRRPFEMFINSKNMEHFQWIVALTRVVSAVFRKGGDVSFLVEELTSVFDPGGGYFEKGGVYVNSLVAKIGNVLKEHLESIGAAQKAQLDVHQQKLVEEKRAEYVEKNGKDALNAEGYPANATVCPKCNTKAVIKMDGCDTCLECGTSKCQ